MPLMLPLFLDLSGRRVVLVGGGIVAAAKLGPLLEARANVHVIAPEIRAEIERAGVPFERRRFEPDDLNETWLAIAAATPEVNRQVAEAAEVRRIFVNAVDDPAHASAFLSGVVRRGDVTLAISTHGAAPALTALLREALAELLPEDLDAWLDEARRQRATWKKNGVAMNQRRSLLLDTLNRLYHRSVDSAAEESNGGVRLQPDPPGPPEGGHYADVAQSFRAAKDAS
jgi:siroheme synthase-like protein